MYFRNYSCVLPFLLVATGCTKLQGSGVSDERSVEVAAFHELVVENAMAVKLTLGPAGPVHIEGDDNIVAVIDVSVRDGQLIISVPDTLELDPTLRLHIEVSTPHVDSIVASGAASVQASGLEGAELRLEASGASMILVDGNVDEIDVYASGDSTVDADELDAEVVQLDLSGGSNASVTATRKMSGSVSGNSTVDVLGKPGDNTLETSGNSQVTYP